jgi:hypothetical protein
MAEVSEIWSWDVVGGLFEPKFEIGTGDEMCIDVTADLPGRGAEVWES